MSRTLRSDHSITPDGETAPRTLAWRCAAAAIDPTATPHADAWLVATLEGDGDAVSLRAFLQNGDADDGEPRRAVCNVPVRVERIDQDGWSHVTWRDDEGMALVRLAMRDGRLRWSNGRLPRLAGLRGGTYDAPLVRPDSD